MQSTIQYLKSELTGLYPPDEIESFARLIIESICGWDFTQQQLLKNKKIEEPDSEKIKTVVVRLKKFEPIQYILGESWFAGLKLKVDASVLIPRPETEELVDWIIQGKLSGNCRIIDIGTGSGCIALAIKNSLKEARVYAVDISDDALKTAIQNAIFNNLPVTFLQADILQWHKYSWEKYDVIVSNPPYIRESEKQAMHVNILDYEPENALFVPDINPLVFYFTIAAFAKTHLVDNGKLFFEINENFGTEMVEMLANEGFVEVELRKDLNGKNRMICCVLKNCSDGLKS